MSQNAVITKQWTLGDRRTAIADTLLDANGVAVDLTGHTVAFRMVADVSGHAVKVNSAAATIDNALLGQVSYSFAAADVDSEKLYDYWWIVTNTASGKIEHFPGDGIKFKLNVVALY